jgi:hypothetical protein
VAVVCVGGLGEIPYGTWTVRCGKRWDYRLELRRVFISHVPVQSFPDFLLCVCWSSGNFMVCNLWLYTLNLKAQVNRDGYDTHYTERYMFHPHANAEGYRRSSVLTHVHRITGDLLLVHGLLDENVHFRHTARLVRVELARFVCIHMFACAD